MGDRESVYADEASGDVKDDLRQHTSSVLLDRVDAVTADTVAIFPFSGADTLDTDYCRRVGLLLTQLLATAVRDGRIDARGGSIANLFRVVHERGLSMERLFTFAYLTERTALDELALSDTIGATS